MGAVVVDVSQGLSGLLVMQAKQERQAFETTRAQLREMEDKLDALRQQAMIRK